MSQKMRVHVWANHSVQTRSLLEKKIFPVASHNLTALIMRRQSSLVDNAPLTSKPKVSSLRLNSSRDTNSKLGELLVMKLRQQTQVTVAATMTKIRP